MVFLDPQTLEPKVHWDEQSHAGTLVKSADYETIAMNPLFQLQTTVVHLWGNMVTILIAVSGENGHSVPLGPRSWLGNSRGNFQTHMVGLVSCSAVFRLFCAQAPTPCKKTPPRPPGNSRMSLDSACVTAPRRRSLSQGSFYTKRLLDLGIGGGSYLN